MFKEQLELLSGYAVKKKKLMDGGIDKYLLSSIMAGIYVSITMFFVVTITSIVKLQFPDVPMHRIVYKRFFL